MSSQQNQNQILPTSPGSARLWTEWAKSDEESDGEKKEATKGGSAMAGKATEKNGKEPETAAARGCGGQAAVTRQQRLEPAQYEDHGLGQQRALPGRGGPEGQRRRQRTA